MPTSHESRTLSRKLMRWRMHRAMIPTRVAMKVATRIGINTSVGFVAPHWARYIITPIGIMHSPDALSTRNISMASLAVSFFGLSCWSSFIAFNPRGVAALSRPSILAETFMNIEPIAGWFFGMPGKSRLKSGLTRRPKNWMTPPCSPIFINPIQSDKIPVRPNEIVKAVSAAPNDEFMISLQTSRFPLNTVSPTATTNAIKKKAIQM